MNGIATAPRNSLPPLAPRNEAFRMSEVPYLKRRKGGSSWYTKTTSRTTEYSTSLSNLLEPPAPYGSRQERGRRAGFCA
jgi:hypothetical protein